MGHPHEDIVDAIERDLVIFHFLGSFAAKPDTMDIFQTFFIIIYEHNHRPVNAAYIGKKIHDHR